MRLFAALMVTAAAAMLTPGVGVAAEDALVGAAFSAAADIDFQTAASAAFDAGPGFVAPSAFGAFRYQPGQGLVRWSSGEIASFGRADLSYLDSVRVSTAAYDAVPGVTLMRPDAEAGVSGPTAYDVTYLRKWPSMVSVGNGRINLDVTPHMGLGFSSGGGRSAEAGALLRMAKAVGITGPSAPRWYMYAGYRKRAMGLNLLRPDDVIRRDRLDDGIMREVQAGFGARRGRVHALVGYTHEMVAMRALGERNRNDDRVGLSLAIR
jgi:hypothetical protein